MDDELRAIVVKALMRSRSDMAAVVRVLEISLGRDMKGEHKANAMARRKADGVSWQDIGNEFGVTKESAFEFVRRYATYGAEARKEPESGSARVERARAMHAMRADGKLWRQIGAQFGMSMNGAWASHKNHCPTCNRRTYEQRED